MANRRPRLMAARPSSKAASGTGVLGSPKLDFEADFRGQDGWVMVKKQRVIILVPPLPVAENSAMQNSALTPLQSEAINITDKCHKSPPLNAVVGTQHEPPVVTLPSIAPFDEPVELSAHNPGGASQISGKALRMRSNNTDRVDTPNLREIHRTTSASKRVIKWPSSMCSSSILEGNALLKQRLRAANLEKKLQKAGGLNPWLASIGVGEEFRRILRRKRMSKLQLANLTMEKLKEMGAVAVGPRRKLIHAIHCVYHP